ncbi:MAG: class II aldolase/adducin family protein [Clostridia bacterium]
MYPTDKEAKELIISIGRKMYEGGFVSANDGNITIRVDDDAVWATPTGVSKGDLSEDKLIKLNMKGEVLEGTWKPTSELAMHLNAYRVDNDLMSTVHAHPLYLSAFACAGIDLDLPSTPAACAISGRVPVIPYECSGSAELANSIIPYVKKYHVVNLGNHGPLAWGKTPIEAWYRMEDAEASCKLALTILQVGRLRPLSRNQLIHLFDFHHVDMTKDAYVAMVDETNNHEPAIPFTEYFKQSLK